MNKKLPWRRIAAGQFLCVKGKLSGFNNGCKYI